MTYDPEFEKTPESENMNAATPTGAVGETADGMEGAMTEDTQRQAEQLPDPAAPTMSGETVPETDAQTDAPEEPAAESASGEALAEETPILQDDGAYRYIPEKHNGYSDAGYVPSGEAGAVPKSYRCGGQEKKTKTRKGVPWAGAIAACLACAVVGGAVGGFVPGLLRGNAEPEAPAAPEIAVVETVPVGAPDRSLSAVPTAGPTTTQMASLVNGGQELSGTDIYYNLATKQVVGITTEITYTNVWGYTSSGAVSGSGFIISEDGYILTNYHVISDAVNGGYDVKVLTYDGQEYVATVVGYEEDNDVAVLKIDATGLSAVTIGDSDSMLVGETVYAVGNPLGELEYTMTDGIVSATDREITSRDSSTGRSTTVNMFQINAAINSGNSGGPVYNSRGEVIGIATAKYSSTGVEGLGFAIPINDAVSIASDLIHDGYVRGKANMGISVGTVSASAAQYYGLVEGAVVASVEEGSCAEAAGIEVSDIIVALGDTEVKSRDDLIHAKRDYHAGDTATLRVYRAGEYIDLTITFDEALPEVEADPDPDSVPPQDEEAQAPLQPQQPQQMPNDSIQDYFNYFYDFFGGNPFGR